jgi:hypothetical protein
MVLSVRSSHSPHPFQTRQRRRGQYFRRYGSLWYIRQHGYTGGVVRELSWAKQEYRALESAGCRKEQLGGLMLEARLL